MDTNALGLAFEDRVANAYVTLGYTVTRRVRAPGQEIDLIASNAFPGIGTVRLAIECRYHAPGVTVGNSEIHEYLSTASYLVERLGFDQAVFITSTRFSVDAQSAGTIAPHVRLLTIEELEHQSFDPTAGLITYVYEYKRDLAPPYYIHLAANLSEQGTTPGETVDVHDLHNYIFAQAQEGASGTIAVLGDFGAGKTTLLYALKYDLARSAISGQSKRLPLLITLKGYYEQHGFESLVRTSLSKEYLTDVPMSSFWKDVSAGRYVVLLDGFDEMVAKADADRRVRLLLELSPLLYGKSLAVITCRPSFFVSEAEYNEATEVLRLASERTPLNIGQGAPDEPIQNRQVIDILRDRLVRRYSSPTLPEGTILAPPRTYLLQTLSSEMILEFLKSHERELLDTVGISASYLFDRLVEIYDLRDLMKRPLVLDMIVETVRSGAIDIADPNLRMGASSLYEAYTASKLDIDWTKGPSRQEFLSQDARRSVAERVAVEMLEVRSFECGPARVEELALDELSDASGRTAPGATVPEILTDIRTCSFMTTTPTGSYEFIHRSFQEFFVARRISRQILTGEVPFALRVELPQEILHFLGAYAAATTDLKDRMSIWAVRPPVGVTENDEAPWTRNLVIALLLTVPSHTGLELGEATLNDFELRSLELLEADWRNVVLQGVHANEIRFLTSKLHSLGLQDCVLGTLVLQECHGSELQFAESEIQGIQISGTNDVFINAISGRVEELTCRETHATILSRGARVGSLSGSRSTVAVETSAGSGALEWVALDTSTVTVRPREGIGPPQVRGAGRAEFVRCRVQFSAGMGLSDVRCDSSVVVVSGLKNDLGDWIATQSVIVFPKSGPGTNLRVRNDPWIGCLVFGLSLDNRSQIDRLADAGTIGIMRVGSEEFVVTTNSFGKPAVRPARSAVDAARRYWIMAEQIRRDTNPTTAAIAGAARELIAKGAAVK